MEQCLATSALFVLYQSVVSMMSKVQWGNHQIHPAPMLAARDVWWEGGDGCRVRSNPGGEQDWWCTLHPIPPPWPDPLTLMHPDLRQPYNSQGRVDTLHGLGLSPGQGGIHQAFSSLPYPSHVTTQSPPPCCYPPTELHWHPSYVQFFDLARASMAHPSVGGFPCQHGSHCNGAHGDMLASLRDWIGH